MLFIEAPETAEQLSAIAGRFAARVPLLANMVEGGATPLQDADQLEGLGFSVVIYPGGIVRALAKTAQAYYASLREHGTNAPFADRMHDFAGLNEVIGTAGMLNAGARYADGDG